MSSAAASSTGSTCLQNGLKEGENEHMDKHKNAKSTF